MNWIPAVQASFTLRLAVMYALLTFLSLGTMLALLGNITNGTRVAFVTMIVIHFLFVLQALIRIPIFILVDPRDLSPASSSFLRTSGCLATLLFLLLNNMACALLVARRQELSLSEAALRDPLTGWHNRRSLAQHAERRFARSLRDDSAFGIVTVDIDHFKRVNDNHGHAAGDAAIRHLALVSEYTLRPQDVLARLGGEEFCALVECDDEASLFQIAERWRAAIQATPLSLQSHSVALTVSVGYSMRSAADRGWGDVLLRADTALYSAKNGGRNRVGQPDYAPPDSAEFGAVAR
jgi:diguanylate cyclase (GGDEF)-like protein